MRAWSGRNGSGPQSGVPWTWPGNNGPDSERGRGFRRVRRNDWTWERVRTAAASTDGWKRTRRGEWRGPCQCGGERDRAWVRRGRGAVVAGCNAGCDGVDVLRWLIPDPVRPGFRRMRGASPPRRDDTPRPRPDTHPEAPRPVQARTTPLPGGGPSKPPNPAPPAETEAAVSPRIDERHPPQGRGTHGFVPSKPDRAAVLWGRLAARPPRSGAPGPAMERTSPPVAPGRTVARGRAVAAPSGRREPGCRIRAPRCLARRGIPRTRPASSWSTWTAPERPGPTRAGSRSDRTAP